MQAEAARREKGAQTDFALIDAKVVDGHASVAPCVRIWVIGHWHSRANVCNQGVRPCVEACVEVCAEACVEACVEAVSPSVSMGDLSNILVQKMLRVSPV